MWLTRCAVGSCTMCLFQRCGGLESSQIRHSQLLRVRSAAYDRSMQAKPNQMGHSSTEPILSDCSTLHYMPAVALQMHGQLPDH